MASPGPDHGACRCCRVIRSAVSREGQEAAPDPRCAQPGRRRPLLLSRAAQGAPWTTLDEGNDPSVPSRGSRLFPASWGALTTPAHLSSGARPLDLEVCCCGPAFGVRSGPARLAGAGSVSLAGGGLARLCARLPRLLQGGGQVRLPRSSVTQSPDLTLPVVSRFPAAVPASHPPGGASPSPTHLTVPSRPPHGGPHTPPLGLASSLRGPCSPCPLTSRWGPLTVPHPGGNLRAAFRDTRGAGRGGSG